MLPDFNQRTLWLIIILYTLIIYCRLRESCAQLSPRSLFIPARVLCHLSRLTQSSIACDRRVEVSSFAIAFLSNQIATMRKRGERNSTGNVVCPVRRFINMQINGDDCARYTRAACGCGKLEPPSAWNSRVASWEQCITRTRARRRIVGPWFMPPLIEIDLLSLAER